MYKFQPASAGGAATGLNQAGLLGGESVQKAANTVGTQAFKFEAGLSQLLSSAVSSTIPAAVEQKCWLASCTKLEGGPRMSTN